MADKDEHKRDRGQTEEQPEGTGRREGGEAGGGIAGGDGAFMGDEEAGSGTTGVARGDTKVGGGGQSTGAGGKGAKGGLDWNEAGPAEEERPVVEKKDDKDEG